VGWPSACLPGDGPLDALIADAMLHKMERGDFDPESPLEWAGGQIRELCAFTALPSMLTTVLFAQARASAHRPICRNAVARGLNTPATLRDRAERRP
jgi:hypothetical protein